MFEITLEVVDILMLRSSIFEDLYSLKLDFRILVHVTSVLSLCLDR